MSRRRRRNALVCVVGLLVLVGMAGTASADGQSRAKTAASAVPYATISGTGSTWSQNMVRKWIADVDKNGMRVVYTGGGSSKGRKDFSQYSVDYAISEIPYQGVDEQGNTDTSNGRPYAYLPIVAGGTAFTYQLKIGDQQVRNLRLSGETLAKIFTNKITNWNDAAITKDNNGRKFPSLPITPVVRSDGSGTTAQLTTWMDKEYSSIWRPYYGKSGLTSYFPVKEGSRTIAQNGSDQVMNTIKGFAGNGHIGYVEYSYPVNANYPVVKVLNKAGYFVEPTQYNVAVGLTRAKINKDQSSQLYLTQILDDVYRHPDPRAYPISSYSYMIIPTGEDDRRMTTAKRQTVADFLFHSLCAGQGSAGSYGYSPLPLNLVQAGFEQIARLKQADSGVELGNRDVKRCNNPTFDGKNLNRNLLAEKAPQPAACDKIGAGPCTDETGTGEPSTDDPNAPGDDPNDPGDDPNDPGNGPNDPDDTGPGDDPEIDPLTGEPLDDSTTTDATGATLYGDPVELSAQRPGDSKAIGWLATLELLALVLVPGLFAVWMRSLAQRRRTASEKEGRA